MTGIVVVLVGLDDGDDDVGDDNVGDDNDGDDNDGDDDVEDDNVGDDDVGDDNSWNLHDDLLLLSVAHPCLFSSSVITSRKDEKFLHNFYQRHQ